MNKGLFALALGTFALGIAEFLMMGILSDVASAMGVSISEAGHFISAYASGVCVGAVGLLFARKMPLRRLMLMLALVIAAGNLLTAVAPDYWTFLAGRFVSGLPHGAYFGVGAIVARKIAAPGRETSAVSIMIAGMTVATLGGVPLGTLITNVGSWRTAFFIVAAAGLLTYIFLRVWLRDVGRLAPVSFRGQFGFLTTLPPWLIFGGVILGQTGIYCWYSYIDPLLTRVCGFGVDSLPWLMALAGFGMFVGNLVAGRLADRFRPSAVAAAVMGAAIPVLIAFYCLAGLSHMWAIVLMMLGTAALFGSGSPLQSSIVRYARGGEMLGAACIQIAYNAGNAVAAFIGGRAIADGMGYGSTAVIGLPFVAVGVILIIVLYRRNERPGALHRPYGS
ncbi:MAG: MFS transporter [Bacteroidales bacterium]|nr:MFS transporter [Bacteroidales bacterium]